MPKIMKPSLYFVLILSFNVNQLKSQSFEVDCAKTYQTIDGFGAHQGDDQVNQSWWQSLYFDDMGCSLYRVDLTPKLISPYSDLSYYSPWFMGSQIDNVFNLEDTDNPNGPENNRVRTYNGPQDYSRLFGGKNAPIAVMGPDINVNITKFKYDQDEAITTGILKKEQLGDFKLIGSLWSPVPWVKVSSGNSWQQNWWPGPVNGSNWPFIWGGNFAGGKLDVSDTPLAVFNDSGMGGTGPTSSITQFVRSTAAYIMGYQNYFNTKFYAISIQNELNFEQFYNSATYPLSDQYIKAVKAIKTEFAKYDELKDILIMGPEDLLGGDAYGLWEYGSSQGPIHKNLQYLQNIEADPESSISVDFYCIHGYDANGVSSSGSNSTSWERWANGWTNSPGPGIPANIKGFKSYNKKSWMTETSGEADPWLSPAGSFPNNGGWSIALKIHQALTSGNQSAWLYWTFTGETNANIASDFALTTQLEGINGPKYNGAKHFFRYIRPNSVRTDVTTNNNNEVVMSAFKNILDSTYTFVLVNQSDLPRVIKIDLQNPEFKTNQYQVYSSSENNYWVQSETVNNNNSMEVSIPGYGVVTLYGKAEKTSAVQESINSSAGITCFPNPASNYTTVSYSTNNESAELVIRDTYGRVMNSYRGLGNNKSINVLNVNTSDYPQGVYLINLKTNSITKTERLIILK